MTTLTENIVNRVDKLPKPGNYAQALQPVFEAISNSTYAIYDRFDEKAVKQGKIEVTVTNIGSPSDIEIGVTDNGVGLDETRFSAFCVVDTDYKKAKGGKGVGRLFWLDAFKAINVTSRFGTNPDNGVSFSFVLRDSEQIQEKSFADSEIQSVGTTVNFSGLRDNEYLQNFPKREDTLLRYFSSHFISDFLMGVSPTIEVNIDGSLTIYPAAVRDLVSHEFESIAWESERYGPIEAAGFLCDAATSSGLDGLHQVHLLADNRTVETRKVDGLIGLGPISTPSADGLCLHVCVDAPYLNARVNEGRTAFNIPESELKKIVREVVEKVKDAFIQKQIAEYKITRAENYREFIASYPIYDYDDPESQLNKVPFGANSFEEFAAGLVKDQVRQEEDRKKAFQAIVEEISEGDFESADFSATIIKAAEDLQKSEQLSLAQHVVRRKLVIELMDVLLKRFRKVGDREAIIYLTKQDGLGHIMLMTNLTASHFQNETNAREHLERIRWPEGPHCPHCGSLNATRLQGAKHRAGAIQCNDCRQQYTVTVGTLFERSKVPLHKWLLCNHLLCSSKKGMSAKQIERMLGVTYKTAWFMCHRIREAMKGCQPAGPLGGGSGVVEADETYVGGKARNRAYSKPPVKKAVVALVEREGTVRSFHVANVNAKTVRALIVTNVDRSAHLITDESPVYTRVGREFGAHYTVNHSAQEYVKHGGYKHSNTAENFFSIFKRGVIGTYHHMSEAHLGRYTGEFDFRYNTRKLTDGERAVISLQAIEGKRLTYRRINKLAA